MLRNILVGAVAGATGTTALNLTTYTDMAIRGRAASSVPATMAAKLGEMAGISALTGGSQNETVQNRQSGTGALLGFAPGLGLGILYGLIRSRTSSMSIPVAGTGVGLGAMAFSDVPIAVLGVSDPRTWSKADWLSDIIPHLVYGMVTVAVYEMLAREQRDRGLFRFLTQGRK